MQPTDDIKQSNLEQLSQNAQKMKELESKMEEIEKKIEEIKLQNDKNKLDENLSKNEIEKLYEQTLDLYEEYNKPAKTRVTLKFVDIFDEIGTRVYESQTNRENLENKKYELENVINELERNAEFDDEKEKKINEDIDIMKSEIEFTKTQYDQLTNENIQLRKEFDQKNNLIGQLQNKLNQLKQLIGKLTEVRVILNKYFSSHFENFTQQERELIQEMQNYRELNNEPKYKEAMNDLLNSNEYGILEKNKDKKSSKHTSKASSKRSSKSKKLQNNEEVKKESSEVSKKEPSEGTKKEPSEYSKKQPSEGNKKDGGESEIYVDKEDEGKNDNVEN